MSDQSDPRAAAEASSTTSTNGSLAPSTISPERRKAQETANKARRLISQRILFGSFRLDQYADPEVFNSSLEVIFADYPVEIVEYVCSPKTGIQRLRPFPPSISEVVEALDGHQEYLRKVEEANRTGRRGSFTREPKRDDTPYVKPDHPDGYFATCAVPPEAPQYQALCDRAAAGEDRTQFRFEQRAGRTWIVVALSWLEREAAARVDTWKPWKIEDLVGYYAEKGSSHLTGNMFAAERRRAPAHKSEEWAT